MGGRRMKKMCNACNALFISKVTNKGEYETLCPKCLSSAEEILRDYKRSSQTFESTYVFNIKSIVINL